MKDKKVLVLGKGFISDHLSFDKIIDRITPDENQIAYILNIYKPDILINCIGMTGKKNIDDCETQKSKTSIANTAIPIILAGECEKKGVKLIHLASGCINYGRSPRYNPNFLGGGILFENYHTIIDPGWREEEFAQQPNNQMSFYSKTKLATDLVIGSMDNVCVLRLRMPISHQNSPRNLLNKLIKYNRVIEEANSVTFVSELIRAIDWVIENKKTGIYNIANPTPITHSILLEEYKKYFPEHKYEKISNEELSTIVVAPRSNCILDVSKSITEGFVYQDIGALVRDTIKEFSKNLKEKNNE